MKITKKIRYPHSIRAEARRLRQQGKTHREIAKELDISTSSAHLWTKGIVISEEQKIAIYKRREHHHWTLKERKLVRVRLQQFWSKPYTREELLDKIKNFYKENGRIPLKREFNSLRVFRYTFGSWNNAIREAGSEPNPVLFAKKFISADGHFCDSFTEKIIDDWFYARGIAHERQWRYGNTKMTADFFIGPNIIIEFFGLAGVQDHYDALIEKKREFCEGNNLHLIELYPADLFPKNRIERKLSSSLILF